MLGCVKQIPENRFTVLGNQNRPSPSLDSIGEKIYRLNGAETDATFRSEWDSDKDIRSRVVMFPFFVGIGIGIGIINIRFWNQFRYSKKNRFLPESELESEESIEREREREMADMDGQMEGRKEGFSVKISNQF